MGHERATPDAISVKQKITFRVVLYGALNHGQQRYGTRGGQFKHTHRNSLDESHTPLVGHMFLPLIYHEIKTFQSHWKIRLKIG